MRHILLAGIAGIALLPAPLLAAPKHKPVHHSAPARDKRDTEIEELKQQVQMLSARLDAQEGAQRSNADQAAAAAAAAAAAQQQAATAKAAADASVKASAAEVKTQLASYEKKGGWWDSTTVSGRMYFNVSTISAKNGGVKTTGAGSLNGAGFNIKRMYVTVDHTFSPIFSGTVTMDASNVIGQTANSNFQTVTASIPAVPAGGAAVPATTTNVNNAALVGKGFFIKQAYLQAKINPALIIRAGSASLPWIGYIENQYGFRHIENTYIDRLSFGTSADWGVHVLGDLAGGLFSYQLSAIDGAGFRNVKVTKTIDFEGRVSTQYKGFYAAFGGYSGKRGNDVQGALLPNGGHLHTASRIDAALGYKNKIFNVGGEYLHAKNWNNVTTNATDTSEGFSLYGNVNFYKTWTLFGRYDSIKPNKDTAPQIKDHYYNVGIQWEPVKIVDLALVYKHDRAIDGAIATSNGTIGAPILGGKYDEFGLWGQFRF
jgi:hypothetical protein